MPPPYRADRRRQLGMPSAWFTFVAIGELCEQNRAYKNACNPLVPRQISASKVVCIGLNRREFKNWGALGHRPLAIGAWFTRRNMPLRPTCVMLPNLVVIYVKRYIRLKNDLSRPGFQGHSRSSELTRNDLQPMTS